MDSSGDSTNLEERTYQPVVITELLRTVIITDRSHMSSRFIWERPCHRFFLHWLHALGQEQLKPAFWVMKNKKWLLLRVHLLPIPGPCNGQ